MTRDIYGREIMVGDLLKIFHYIGVRRQKHYMYKYVLSVDTKRITLLHLNVAGDYCNMLNDGEKHYDIEIVQGYGADGVCFSDRPKN